MATTQEVLDSTNKLLERIKTEGITTNSGQLINPADYNKPISADMLATPQTAVQLPPQPTDNTNYSGLTAGGNAEINSLTSTATATTDPNEMPAWVKTFLENQPTPTNPSDTYNTLYNSSGIDEKQKAVNESQNRINALKAQLEGIDIETKQAGLKLKDEGISSGAIQGRNLANERSAAIRALPLQAAILAENATLTGNTALLDQATSKLNTAFKLQSQYETQQFQYNQNLIDKVFSFADKQQQQLLEQKKLMEQRTYNERQDLFSTAQKYASMALQNGQSDIAAALANPNLTNEQMQGLIKQINVPQTTKKNGIENENRSTGQLSTITQAVIDNPNLLNSLTPTINGQVISELQGAGYDIAGLGDKPLSDTAIKELTQTKSAVENLNSLKQTIKDNLEFIGPIKGFAALNPWSKAKKVQADIARIKQVVGKALEGGVLRKEDEDKYKKILAELTDTPETAMYKIDQLITDIQGDIDDYTALQQGAGKSLNIKSSLQIKGSGSSGQTSTGNTYKIKQK